VLPAALLVISCIELPQFQATVQDAWAAMQQAEEGTFKHWTYRHAEFGTAIIHNKCWVEGLPAT
jgi:hypothetical protein